MLHPIGGLPSRTYWRRRAMLGGALLMSAVLIKVEIFGGGSSDAATRAAPERNATTAPRPSRAVPQLAVTRTRSDQPKLPPEPLPTCTEKQLSLRVVPGAASYRLGELPVVVYTVRNRIGSTCRRDLGPAMQEALVYNRSTRLWSSNDCWPGVEHRVVTLRPGHPETFSMRWSRTSSLPECAGIRRVVPAGTYTLIGRVGNLQARAPINLS